MLSMYNISQVETFWEANYCRAEGVSLTALNISTSPQDGGYQEGTNINQKKFSHKETLFKEFLEIMMIN